MASLKKAMALQQSPSVQKGRLPKDMFAEVLNNQDVVNSRYVIDADEYYLHVSNLIRVTKQDMFCPREHALYVLDGKEHARRALSPGFSLLFAMGHSVHEHVVTSFLRNSPNASVIYGRWVCNCGRKLVHGFRPDKKRANICTKCGTVPRQYVEYSIVNDKYKIIGHPDILIMWNGRVHVYEIKSIDRKDILFDDLKHPLGDHVLQASFYAWLLLWAGFKVSKRLRFIYVDRTNSKLFYGSPYKEFSCPVASEKRILPFLKKATKVQNAIQKKKLPGRICPNVKCARAKNCKVVVSCFAREGTSYA